MEEKCTCRICQSPFIIYDEDFNFYKKFEVPEPKRCPTCRARRRFAERNTHNLYWRKCDLTGEKTLSWYSAKTPFPVYSTQSWWNEKWDALDYGRDFDFGKPFFEQFQELKNYVPHVALYIINNTLENSDYTNCTGYLKKCYLIFESDYDEDCYYSNLLKHCKNMVDCSICYDSELCYECINCLNCYNVKFSCDSRQCQNSFALVDCQACENCIGCINQRHKRYMIFNKQYSVEEYEKLKKDFSLDTKQGIKNLLVQCETFFKTQPHKALQAEHNENSLGDHLYNCKNSTYCFDSKDLEDCRYCARLSLGVKNSMDYNSWGDNAELVYESASCGHHIYNVKFCSTCETDLRDCEYCMQCNASNNLFGCIGLKRASYCILNKQYKPEDFFALRTKIIDHMKHTREYGEFFPAHLCSFGYNETIAMDYFPLTREQALKQGYQWKEASEPELKMETSDIFMCRDCKRNFKLIPQELRFYKELNIPAPEKCFHCRYADRMKKINPYTIFERDCSKCVAKIKTTYAPEYPEIVYCDKCYLEAFY